MKKILLLFSAIVIAVGSYAQDITVSGKVSSAEDGSAIPGVNVLVKGTTNGTVTDSEGRFSISAPGTGVLIFSFIGLKTQEISVGGRATIDIALALDATELTEVVVTALGVSRDVKTLPYASQEVKSKQLNITNDANLKNALAGKVAGVTVNGQAGSKLGQFGKIRIRGAISLTQDNDPLYIVDGVPVTDPNDVDMDNVESVNVLKGPAATAAYGQRADAGVIVISTKKGSADKISVEIANATTFDKVAYLPNYQNKYGGGYEGDGSWSTFNFADGAGAGYLDEWAALDGQRALYADNNYADESWGPRFDGQDYVPWYAWWPDSPYFGETAKYSAKPNNVKDFFETGVTQKSSVAITGGGKNFKGRLSYTKLDQTGIIPYTWMKKDFINTSFEYTALEKLTVTANLRYTASKIRGDFDDGYGNQTSGSFNQWFNRNLDMTKMKQLRNLTTPDGVSASWNWWGPDYFAGGGGYRKPAFWFNPYTYMEQYKIDQKNENFTGSLAATYKITDHLSVSAMASRTQTEYDRNWKVPFFISNSSAPELYNSWSNSFGVYRRSQYENNFNASLNYKNTFANGDFDVDAYLYGNLRHDGYDRFSAEMNPGAKSGGLIIPDLYSFSNAGEVPTPARFFYEKKVNSIYGRASFGYKGMAYLDLGYRKDYSSALPTKNNGYGYPSVGANFIFSEVLNVPFLSYGKVRAGWAQVGSDVGALLISQTFPTAAKPFGSSIVMYSPTTLVDPNLKPALNSSYEGGFDVKFFENRVGLSFTYYNETRTDEIISVSIPVTSGYTNFLTNAGETQRQGIEISVSGDVLKLNNGFTWNSMVNFSTYNVKVNELPGDLKAIANPGGSSDWAFIAVVNPLGGQWGELRGRAIKRDADGNKVVNADGLYEVEVDHDFGSVIPDFNGGFINTFGYKGITLQVSIDFQKGGKFYSESEMWGNYSGLLKETAGKNDLGNEIRNPVTGGEDSGGVHVKGVLEDGTPFDGYVEGYDYVTQWNANTIAEPFVHGASFIKVRDVSLSYDFAKLMKLQFVKGFTVGVVGRNLARFGLSKDNKHKWDPSEMAQSYGESGQLPGLRSYGFNVKVTF
jgi:TonB-linked SusC/RagA family outer membrane protein